MYRGQSQVISRSFRGHIGRARMMARNFWIICLCANLFLLLELGFDSLLWTNLVQTASFRGCDAHSHSRSLMSGKEYFVATYVQGQEDDFIRRKKSRLNALCESNFVVFVILSLASLIGRMGIRLKVSRTASLRTKI